MTDVNIKKISDNMIELEARGLEHTPYNKAAWEVEDAACTIKVRDYDGKNKSNTNAWTEIHLSERYTPKNGKRPVNRDIFVTLDTKQRKALIAALLREEGVQV
jgi:DNA-directed RNA polymerase subunit L